MPSRDLTIQPYDLPGAAANTDVLVSLELVDSNSIPQPGYDIASGAGVAGTYTATIRSSAVVVALPSTESLTPQLYWRFKAQWGSASGYRLYTSGLISLEDAGGALTLPEFLALEAIPGTTVGLTADEVAAINAANAADGDNPFATLADITASGGGNVSKVGTPVNDQVGVWTGDGLIEGDADLTFDGSNLSVGGNIVVGGTVDGRDVATDGGTLDTALQPGDVDDTPVDGATTAPVSSNWAYDHVAAADPHPGYLTETAAATVATTGAYSDLSGTPTPAADIDQYDIAARLAAGTGTYTGVAVGDLTEEATPAAGDLLIGWESGGALRKFDIGNLPGGGAGGVGTSGTPVANDFARFTNATTIEGRSYAEAKSDLGLGSAADVATDLADLNEATIEAAIDTLANLTSVQGLTVTLADAGANALWGWDDTAGAYENLSAAEARAVLNVEDGANVTNTSTVTAAGALMDTEVDADIKTLALPASTTISAFGATLVDDASAGDARTTLDVDQAGTAASGDSAHLSAFNHANLLTSDERAGFNAGTAIDAANPPATIDDLPTVVTDHGALSGLADDDHTQYLTNTRGDARYAQSTDDSVTNILTVTQAAYDALTPDSTTLYLICG